MIEEDHKMFSSINLMQCSLHTRREY